MEKGYAHAQEKRDRLQLEEVLEDEGTVAQLGNRDEYEIDEEHSYVDSYSN